MITLKDWMEGVKYKVTDTWDFQWECFCSNAMVLESDWSGADWLSYTITYDKDTLEVFEVCSYNAPADEDCTALRWISPGYRKAYFAEEKSRGMCGFVNFTEVKSPGGWSWLTKMLGF